MSTSLIYHAFGVHGYQYVRIFFKKGKIYFVIQAHDSKVRCPDCGSWHVIRKGTQTRYLKLNIVLLFAKFSVGIG